MPLGQWQAFYAATQAVHLERLAAMVAVVHPANPKRLRDQLMQRAASARAAAAGGRARPLVADPKRLRALLGGIRGVAIEVKTPPETDDGINR